MLEEREKPLSDEIRSAGLEDIIKVEALAAHITSSSVHNLLSIDNTLSQVSLELCNAKRTQQLQIMAAMDEKSIHFGKASQGIVAKKAGGVVHLLQGVSMKARLRSDVNGSCHNDIPIELKTHAGKIMNLFASPLSLIVQSASPPITCSNTPVMFQIKGN
jgi:hypothetical protein